MSQSISGSCNTTTTTTTTRACRAPFPERRPTGRAGLYNKINTPVHTPPPSIHPPPLPFSSSSPLLLFYFYFKEKDEDDGVTTSFPARCQKNTRRSQSSSIDFFLPPVCCCYFFFGWEGGTLSHIYLNYLYTHRERDRCVYSEDFCPPVGCLFFSPGVCGLDNMGRSLYF